MSGPTLSKIVTHPFQMLLVERLEWSSCLYSLHFEVLFIFLTARLYVTFPNSARLLSVSFTLDSNYLFFPSLWVFPAPPSRGWLPHGPSSPRKMSLIGMMVIVDSNPSPPKSLSAPLFSSPYLLLDLLLFFHGGAASPSLSPFFFQLPLPCF